MKLFLGLWFFYFQLGGWELLSSVDIVKGYDDFMGTEVEKPEFSDELLDARGSQITLEGFIIPLEQDQSQDYFVLSRFPYASCFFCGAAGPETVVEVYADQKIKYTDEQVIVTGTLFLNDDNPFQLFYILKDAEVKKMD